MFWNTKRIVSLTAMILATAAGLMADEGLKWETRPGYRYADLPVPKTGKTGFTMLSPVDTGILWTNVLSIEKLRRRQYLFNGCGVAAGDFDADGRCDLYFCNREGSNALFRNLGNWKFENVTTHSGVVWQNASSSGAAFADVNGDGLLDLLVNSFAGPNALFLNLGHGQFTNMTAASGLLSRGGATTLALGDIDGDGDLDLYVCYYGVESVLFDGIPYQVRTENGRQVIGGRYAQRLKIENGQLIEMGEPDVLYLNDGHGHFTPANWEQTFADEEGRPMSAPLDFGLAAQIRDINGDGWPDIYVCNDFLTPDRMWLNDGHGHFRASDRLAQRKMSNDSMGVDFADIDRDGHLDFFTVEMLNREHSRQMRLTRSLESVKREIGRIDNREEAPRNTLFLNRGDGTYAEIAWFSGLAASDWSWSPIFLDVDLDGYEDVLISNGTLSDMSSRDPVSKANWPTPVRDTPKAAFRNRGDRTFEDVTDAWGFNAREISHGMALADLDGDGDLDVVLNTLNGPPLIYRNDSIAPRVAVRLKGLNGNTQGIGANIWLYGGAVPMQSQEMICGGRYLSCDEAMRVFAAGSLTNEMRIEVRWRSGRRSVVNDVKANRVYEIDEAGAEPFAEKPGPVLKPIFEDASQLLAHAHSEEEYNDFERQPLLPNKLSQLGPGVAWFDFDGDGWDDLLIGSGKGGTLAVYRNDGRGGFTRITNEVTRMVTQRDQTGIVGMGSGKVLVGFSNYEDAQTSGASVTEFDFVKNTAESCVPQTGSSIGPLALADIDGDGDLDLFVGGRVVPGRYPEAASSAIYENDGDHFKLRQELSGVGMVDGAVWSDLDGDGYPELILACEWGPVRVFHNERGHLKEATRELGLDQYTGWWNGVNVGDFDGDGRLDIVVGNWGQNSPYRASREHPCKLYYGDLSGHGTVDIIEASYDERMKTEVPVRDLNFMGGALPWIREKFATHAAYGQADVAAILSDKLAATRQLSANTLKTTVFLNRGDHFEARSLPDEAQFSPAFAVCVGDFDGDGSEDVFLSQNFFATRPDAVRLDAGRGLWLKGDGRGGFQSMPGQESGVKVYGEQRGAALCDYDGDGRIDLVVSQNGAATKIFHNTGARPGLRVRLKGPAGNPHGVGAQLRLVFEGRRGPVREVHAGSGYWSQDSVVQVLATPAAPTGIEILWPGGKMTSTPLPQKFKEITVDTTGRLETSR